MTLYRIVDTKLIESPTFHSSKAEARRICKLVNDWCKQRRFYVQEINQHEEQSNA